MNWYDLFLLLYNYIGKINLKEVVKCLMSKLLTSELSFIN